PPGEAKFEEDCRAPRRGEEVRKILVAGVVHAAAGMARAQIARVEIVPFVAQAGLTFGKIEVAVGDHATAQAAVGREGCNVDAAGFAGVAARAVRMVNVAARQAKTARQ